MEEERIRHLEIIQAVVGRMAGNSFYLKGWTVTVATGLLAFAAKESEPRYAWVALLPTLAFWGLDGYYLRQERLFRKLFDNRRARGNGAPDGSDPFSLDASAHAGQVPSWASTLWAPSVAALHGPVFAAVLAVALLVSPPG